MPTEKVFFSYARTETDFALKLAKDLRDAGANVWIDQLDIKEKRTTIENYVIMILAGEISEFLLTRRHNLLDSLSDYFEAYKMTLHHLCISSDKFDPDNRETELYMKWLSERCKIILKTPQNWCAVKTIAHELVKRKVIRGCEAVDIIKNSRLKNDTIQSKKRAHSNLANSTLKPRNILL